DGGRLRLRDGLGPHQGRQRLGAVARQQQSRQVLPEAPALDVGVEQLVEALCILVEGQRDGRGVVQLRWGHWPPPSVVCVLSHHPHPTTYSNKVPIIWLPPVWQQRLMIAGAKPMVQLNDSPLDYSLNRGVVDPSGSMHARRQNLCVARCFPGTTSFQRQH